MFLAAVAKNAAGLVLLQLLFLQALREILLNLQF
jgi:hypothetical protein